MVAFALEEWRTCLGFLTFGIGLAVAMPVLGHATWRLYRALVPRAT